MAINNNCERCFQVRRQFFPAALMAPDGEKLCLACIRELEISPEDCEALLPVPEPVKPVATPKLAGDVVKHVTVPAADVPQERVAKRAPESITTEGEAMPRGQGTFNPKPCKVCSKEFTPNGPRSEKCESCRAGKGETESAPKKRACTRRQAAEPTPTFDEDTLAKLVDAVWSGWPLAQKLAAVRAQLNLE